jgi:hypothetical protein
MELICVSGVEQDGGCSVAEVVEADGWQVGAPNCWACLQSY